MPQLYKILANVFDITSGIVSLLDLATDLVILITWYYDGKIVFFTISLCILILAQLSYLILFYYNHGKNSRDTACHSILSVNYYIYLIYTNACYHIPRVIHCIT
eukprot:327115_1